MGPKAAPAAASWRLWRSMVRQRRCAPATSACGTSRRGSSVESRTKAGSGSQGLARVPRARRSLAEHFCRLAHDQVVVQPSRFILPEAGREARDVGGGACIRCENVAMGRSHGQACRLDGLATHRFLAGGCSAYATTCPPAARLATYPRAAGAKPPSRFRYAPPTSRRGG